MNKKTLYSNYFWTACLVLFVLCMVMFPKDVFSAAKAGMEAWWQMVFSALLPFFVGSELLMGFGIVRFMGVLLEPVMRPLFNVPGAGSFVLAVGYTSGFPIGAIVTAKLRREKLCTRIEAERLVSFTNNSSPLFMLAAVSVGMFHDPQLGMVIAGSHYTANLTLGLLLGFYGRNDQEVLPYPRPQGKIIMRAFQELTKAQSANQRPLGNLLGQAVKESVNKLLVIGGFIIIFSVFIKILSILGILNILAGVLGIIVQPLGLNYQVGTPMATGFLEMTMGAKVASETTLPLIQQVMATSFVLGWSGLCVHAQVAAMLSETDIRMLPFIITRFFHGILAALYTYLLLGPGNPIFNYLTRPVFNQLMERKVFTSWQGNLEFFGLLAAFILVAAIAGGIVLFLLKNLRIIWLRTR